MNLSAVSTAFLLLLSPVLCAACLGSPFSVSTTGTGGASTTTGTATATCASTCPAGTTCVDGACGCPSPDYTVCGGACLHTGADVDNCGACGTRCEPGDVCTGGQCTCAGDLTCTMPAPVCTQKKGAGDPENCGKCGTVCEDAQVCTAGACVCRPSLTLCEGSCVDLGSDPENCGACGTKCMAAGSKCIAPAMGMPGKCSPPGTSLLCPAGYTDCGNGSCLLTTALKGNPIHCGTCNTVCAPDEVCTTDGICMEYFASPSCTTCPCDACGSDHVCCKTGDVALCVSGTTCGP